MGKRWIPLESNPDVLNDFSQKLGLDVSQYSFCDVFGLDPVIIAIQLSFVLQNEASRRANELLSILNVDISPARRTDAALAQRGVLFPLLPDRADGPPGAASHGAAAVLGAHHALPHHESHRGSQGQT